jgi:phasin family protein
MTSQIFPGLFDQSANLLAPVQEFNKLAIAKAEKLFELQLASLQGYSELAIAQLKATLEISSPEGFQSYLGKQGDFLKVLGEKVADDARAVTELSSEFGAEAQEIAKESVTTESANAA